MTKQRHRMAVAAHLILYSDERQVLFMRRANTGYADGQWSVPAGHVESGETLAEACTRETIEEIGVTLDTTSLAAVLVQHKHDTDGEERIDIFFAADLPPGQTPTIREHHACDALTWRDPARPPTPTVPYVAAALAAIIQPDAPVVSYFGF